MPNRNDFSQWLEMQFIEWMARDRKRKTVTAFAAWMGINPSLMTRYMNGQMRPTGEKVDKIAAKLGPEIYDVLGLARPDPREARLLDLFRGLDEAQKETALTYLQRQGEHT